MNSTLFWQTVLTKWRASKCHGWARHLPPPLAKNHPAQLNNFTWQATGERVTCEKKHRKERWSVRRTGLLAVDVNLGCCNGEFLLLLDCLRRWCSQANGSRVKRRQTLSGLWVLGFLQIIDLKTKQSEVRAWHQQRDEEFQAREGSKVLQTLLHYMKLWQASKKGTAKLRSLRLPALR